MLTDINIEMVLKMIFFSFTNTNFQCNISKLISRSYSVVETLPTTNRVEPINKKEFAKVAVDKNSKILVVHITTLEAILIYPSRVSQLQDEPTLAIL